MHILFVCNRARDFVALINNQAMKLAAYTLPIFLFFVLACGSVEDTSLHYVNDSADVLTSEQEQMLKMELKELQDSIGSQLAVLIIDSLNGESIESYSLRTAQEWKLGRKNYNDGVLITVSIFDRKMRIEVGTGLEDIIRNETAAQIIQDDMVSNFRQENYFEGLLRAVQHIKKLIRENKQFIGEAIKMPMNTIRDSNNQVSNDVLTIDDYLVEGITDSAVQNISGSLVLIIQPTEEQIDEMIKEYGEDTFYTVSDDANFYQGTALGLIDSIGVKTATAEKRYIRYRGVIREWLLDVRKQNTPPWNMIFFHPEKRPEIVSSIDVSEEMIKDFFELP